MDELTKFLVKELIDGESVTAIYGGGFKPPTKGHFDLVKTALKDFKDIDKFLIYVGSGVRDGIEQEQALQIWDIYKELLPSKVQIEPSATPIGDIMRYAKNHPDEKVYFVIGYREGREDDLDDIKNRTKGVEEKYPNLEVRVIKTPSGDMSGTNARKALKKGDKEQFFTYLPTEVPANEKEDIYNILEPTVMKEGEMGAVQFDVLDNYNQQDIIDDIKNKFNKFISAVKQENKETKESVSLLIKAAKGNTTLTDEQKKEIGDQLKDVLRLIGLTAIATLPGGFIAAALIKLFKAESLITPSAFANEGSCGYDIDAKTGKQLTTPGGLEEADPKTGTGKKPKGSSRRLYTDEDPSDTVKVKFSTKQDIIDTFSKASFKSKPHARKSQVINLIHQRVRAAYERSKDPEVKKRLKTALDYAEQKKEASKEKTQRLNKLNEIDISKYISSWVDTKTLKKQKDFPESIFLYLKKERYFNKGEIYRVLTLDPLVVILKQNTEYIDLDKFLEDNQDIEPYDDLYSTYQDEKEVIARLDKNFSFEDIHYASSTGMNMNPFLKNLDKNKLKNDILKKDQGKLLSFTKEKEAANDIFYTSINFLEDDEDLDEIKVKETLDPQSGKAAPYGSGYTPVKIKNYD
jgi:hypothetical protein